MLVLMETDDRYRSIFDEVDDCIFVYDIETGKIIDANKRMCKLFGYTKDEAIRLKVKALSVNEPQYSSEKIVELLNKAAKGEPQLFEWKCKDKSGRVFWAEINLKPFLIGDRKCLFAVVRNIIKYKMAYQKLYESEKKYRVVTECVPIYLTATNECHKDGKLILWNKYAEKMLGYTSKEIIGKFPASAIHESQEDAEEVISSVKTKGIYDKEVNFVHKDGSLVPVHVVVVPRKNDRGEIVSLYGFALNITERKQMEKALWDSENKYQSIFEATGTATGIVEEDGTISMVNSEFERLFGYCKEEVEGKRSYVEFLTERDLEKVKEYHYLRIFNLSKVPRTYECQLVDKECNIRDILMTVALIPGTKRSVTSLLDITERKRSLKRLLIYRDKLRVLTSQLSLAEERERRRIASYIHDAIGHSLAIIKIKLGTFRESLSSQSLSRALKEIRDLVEQTICKTRELTFEISPPVLYELGFDASVEWLLEEMQKESGIMTDLEVDKLSKPLDDDISILLYQAVRELLVNIAKHAHAHKVKISIRRKDSNIQVKVEDDGVGFDAFNHSFHIRENLGFGLFSIRERLNHIGGYLKIESKLRHGTKVTLVTPLKHERRTIMEEII